MSISTYSELKTAVANWLHRSDLTAHIPDFITLAEAQLSADITSRAMEARTTLTCTAGDAWVTLPSDMIEMRRLLVNRPDGTVLPLRYVTPDEITNDFALQESGLPVVFTVIGSQAQLARTPDTDYTLELSYIQKIPALSDANPTNWLLTKFPNVYLHGALMQAQPFMQDDARMPIFEKLLLQGIAAINNIDWYSGSTMTVRVS